MVTPCPCPELLLCLGAGGTVVVTLAAVLAGGDTGGAPDTATARLRCLTRFGGGSFSAAGVPVKLTARAAESAKGTGLERGVARLVTLLAAPAAKNAAANAAAAHTTAAPASFSTPSMVPP